MRANMTRSSLVLLVQCVVVLCFGACICVRDSHTFMVCFDAVIVGVRQKEPPLHRDAHQLVQTVIQLKSN